MRRWSFPETQTPKARVCDCLEALVRHFSTPAERGSSSQQPAHLQTMCVSSSALDKAVPGSSMPDFSRASPSHAENRENRHPSCRMPASGGALRVTNKSLSIQCPPCFHRQTSQSTGGCFSNDEFPNFQSWSTQEEGLIVSLG